MNEKKKPKLATVILLCMLAGAILGSLLYLVPENTFVDDWIVNGLFQVLGQGFLKLLQMLVVPLVFFSITNGASSMGDVKTLGKAGVTTLIFYLCTTAIAIIIALTMANITNPGLHFAVAEAAKSELTIGEPTGVVDMLLGIIPKNPVASLSNGSMLEIIFFALMLGIIIGKLGDQVQIIKDFISKGNLIMMTMTEVVMKVAPIGVFCLVGKTFATLGFNAFVPLIKYILTVLVALLIHAGVVYPTMMILFGHLKPSVFYKKYVNVMALAFSTCNSASTIPEAIETLEMDLGVSPKISSFTIPLGATINMDGTAIMQGVAVVFTSQAFGIPLDAHAYLMVILTATMASIGTTNVPSAGLVMLSMVFDSVGLPLEGIAIIMGIDRIVDMFRTSVNVAGDGMCTTIVAKRNNLFDEDVYYDRKQLEEPAAAAE